MFVRRDKQLPLRPITASTLKCSIGRSGLHYRAITFLLVIHLSWSLLACNATSSPTQIAASRPLLGPYSFTPVPPAYTHTGKLILAGLQFPGAANPLFASSPPDFTLDNALWA